MSPDPFDDRTADAFLAGEIAPRNAPLGYQRAADLISAARSPASTSELAAEDQVVAALLAQVRAARPLKAIPRRHTLGKILTVKMAVLATVIFGGGVAVAATGEIPAHVRSAISAGLAAVGLTPSHNGNPAGTPAPSSGPSLTTTSTPGNAAANTNTGGHCAAITINSGSTATGVGGTTTLPPSSTSSCSNPAASAGIPATPAGTPGSNASAPDGNSNGAGGVAPSPTTTSPPKYTTHGPPAGTPNGPPTTAITSTTTSTSPTSGNNGNGNNNGKGVGNGKGNSSGKSATHRPGSSVANGTEESA